MNNASRFREAGLRGDGGTGVIGRAAAARWTAGGIAAGSLALMGSGLALAYADRHLLPARLTGWDFSDVFGAVVDLTVPVLGLVLTHKRPRNRIGWLFVAAGLAMGLWAFSASFARHALVAAPGAVLAGRAFAWLSFWTWVIPLAIATFVFLLFPDGQLRSRRWRPAAWFVAGAFTLAALDLLVNAFRAWQRPFAMFSVGPYRPDLIATVFLMLAALLVGVAAVVVRFVRSVGEERLQLKWFTAAAVLLLATQILSVPSNSAASSALGDLAVLCLLVAIAVAMLKYRLYDIDIVIGKAVLYGSLAMIITAVYAAVVAGVGTLVGNQRSPLLAALAAAVVAVVFQPGRQWAGRLANRLVYGRRATPYQVLSDFAQRIGGAYASQDVLPQMAQIVAAGTGAERVVVWLRVDDELRPQASSDHGWRGAPLCVDGDELPALPDADLSVRVMHRVELLGAISIKMPKGETLRPAGRQLVIDVASQAGLVLANAGLIEDLRASRQRLVSAQDEARRRLERNIHDGAQQDLVALAIKVGLGTTVDDLTKAREIFGELQADAASALASLRDLARGIYPPLLADLGLAAALNAQARRSPVPVVVHASEIGRFGQDIEAAVYFCCLEALQNTAKYANATQASIRLEVQDEMLRFIVSDNGIGYDARGTRPGSGQRNMADRIAALGGQLEIESTTSNGTVITGHLPIVSRQSSELKPLLR